MGELEPVGQHQVKVIPRKDDYTFRCACGAVPPAGKILLKRLDAVDEGEKHLSEMRRIRGLVHGKRVTLEAEHAYYLERLSDPDLSTEERAQWVALEDQLSKRLGLQAPPSVQEELFPLMGTD